MLRLSALLFVIAVVTGWVTFSSVGYSSIDWTAKLFFWLCSVLFVVTYVLGQGTREVDGE